MNSFRIAKVIIVFSLLSYLSVTFLRNYNSPKNIEKRCIRKFEKDTKRIKHDLLRICWYMRGGISYTEAHQLSPSEREIISNIIKENLETTKNSKLPFF